MRFSILSHAGLFLESNSVSILTDPWLLGSCYWRSWWNFPEPDESLINGLRPNYIYLTHLHWDHFHGPSLRRFDRKTPILVPKIPSLRMIEDLHKMGFKEIVEIPHGGKFQLADQFTLHSFQFGPCADSAVVYSSPEATVLNANDCKLFGSSLREMTKQFPKIDFVLRSFSSASALPYCVQGYETRFPEHRSSQNYIREFTAFGLTVSARYAVPFASNHCFLHPETMHFNATSVSPQDVCDFYNQQAAKLHVASECLVMPPGSTWSSEQGFAIQTFDYAKKQEYVDKLKEKYQQKLEAQLIRETSTVLRTEDLQKYFQAFSRSIPWLVKKMVPLRFALEVPNAQIPNRWEIDVTHGEVKESPKPNPDIFTIRCQALVFADCARRKMFSVWTASKRLQITVPASHRSLKQVSLLFSLLDLYELDLIPLYKNLSLRHLSVWARRWREVAEIVGIMLRARVLRRPFDLLSRYPVELEPEFTQPMTSAR